MALKPEKPRIAIVCGEISGDILGAGLIEALQAKLPDARFEGIPGPLMEAQGCTQFFPMERLAVMGISTEVLARIPELYAIRKELKKYYLANPPDVFIGIDAPDFNLNLERTLFEAGIPTVHYVSPSVWAWRQYRVKKIVRSMNLMLTLFPFEPDFYNHHGLKAIFVGHPLADKIAMEQDKGLVRQRLGLAPQGEMIALLPGSRSGEVKRMAGLMIETANWCLRHRPGLQFLVPFANAKARAQFESRLAASGKQLPIHLFDGQSQDVMAAADCVLLASGTATLECMLLKTPMVVTYKMSPMSFWIMKRLAKVQYVALPNLLSKALLVPEILQNDAKPEVLGQALLDWFEDRKRTQKIIETFHLIHSQLRRGASENAANAVLDLLGE